MPTQLDFGATGAGVAIGAGVGGPLGAVVGGALGFGIDLLDYVSGSANDQQAEALDDAGRLIQAKSDVSNLTVNVGIAKTNILSTEKTISAYESFLDAFPNYADLQKNTFEAQSRSEFKGLLNNYAMGNARAGSTGRAGGSAGLISAEDRAELADYAGDDLVLGGGDGGRYQMARDETYNNLTMQEQQARDQLGIYQSTLGNINETLGLYEAALTDAQNRVTDLEGKSTGGDGTTPGGTPGVNVQRDRDGGIVLPVATPAAPATMTPEQYAAKIKQIEEDKADAAAARAAAKELRASKKKENVDRDPGSSYKPPKNSDMAIL